MLSIYFVQQTSLRGRILAFGNLFKNLRAALHMYKIHRNRSLKTGVNGRSKLFSSWNHIYIWSSCQLRSTHSNHPCDHRHVCLYGGSIQHHVDPSNFWTWTKRFLHIHVGSIIQWTEHLGRVLYISKTFEKIVLDTTVKDKVVLVDFYAEYAWTSSSKHFWLGKSQQLVWPMPNALPDSQKIGRR